MKRKLLIISVSAGSLLAIAALAQDTSKPITERPGSGFTTPAKTGSGVIKARDRDDRMSTNAMFTTTNVMFSTNAVRHYRDRDDRDEEHRDRDDRVTPNSAGAPRNDE